MKLETGIVALEADPVPCTHNPAVVEFRRRLAYLTSSLEFAQAYEAHVGTFNEGLANLVHAVSPRARRKPAKIRLHPFLEMAVGLLWLQRQRGMGLNQNRAPTPDEMLDLCREVAVTVKPLRGRPAHVALTHHVHGLMALVQETCGSPATASRTRDSLYDPHMTSAGGKVVERIFRGIDPSISVTALVNIILDAHSSGAVDGKRFLDFFPFYGGRLDPATGRPTPAPSFRLEHFEAGYPLDCS